MNTTAIFRVVRPASALIAAAAAAVLAAGGAGAATSTQPPPALLNSRSLWTTIDVCNTHKHPGVVGVRGSMPGDGQIGQTMYMRFQLQYQSGTSWVYAPGADSGYVLVGRANYHARQSGYDFTIKPGSGSYVTRGVVTFQWRKGVSVLLSTIRDTTAGHPSAAGSDPRNYSAATCALS
jgi:opacity protein-like surface antigen